jgi:thiamine biosynthesis lipoprotein
MHRRDFLDPRHVAHAAAPLLSVLDDSAPAPAPVCDEVALLRFGWRAMATTFEIVLPFDAVGAQSAAREAFELLDALEDQMTVYRDTSEICRVNRLAWRKPVRVEARLFDLLALARRIHEQTEGAFDVTTGAIIKAWGFFRGPRRVPSNDERATALQRVGMQHVEMDGERRSVRSHREGLEINLGSIGKGYALDRLGELLASRWKMRTMLLHGGSSSVYAKGDPHGDGRGWRLRIRHPWRAGRYLADVWLRDQSLGTSAATFQYLEHEGKKLGHVLDPRTGWPAAGLASVSVVAPTAAEADALSTAFYVGGIDVARHWCETHPDTGAILLPEGSTRPVVVGLDAAVIQWDR